MRDFTVTWTAEVQSIAGDQVARVALSLLVFAATGSAPATAATYAATFLPGLFGGLWLARVGDRLPRPTVMAGCDLIRAACFGIMSIRGVPLGWVVALVVIASLLAPVFTAAQMGYLAAKLSGEQYRIATAVRLTSSQAIQAAGFALGGLLVAWLGARPVLMLNALTYLLSAFLIAVGLREGRRVSSATEATARAVRPLPFRGVWADCRLRVLVALTLLTGFFAVPEALAAPFADQISSSAASVGLLLASMAAGAAVGSFAIVRVRSAGRREAIAQMMAIGCGVPLLIPAFASGLGVALACWATAGLLSAYMVEIMSRLIRSIPDSRRARTGGVLAALLLAAQGGGQVIFGFAAAKWSAASVIASAGAIGSVLALILVTRTQNMRSLIRASRGHLAGRHRERPAPFLHGSAERSVTVAGGSLSSGDQLPSTARDI